MWRFQVVKVSLATSQFPDDDIWVATLIPMKDRPMSEDMIRSLI
jgi:hypothetical protein